MGVIPYLWGSGLNGTIGVRNRTADVDASFADIFDELNFGFMGVFGANRNRFTTLADVVYLNLSDKHATPGPLFSSANVVQKSLILTPLAGYRILGAGSSFLDVLGGIRFWNIDANLKLAPGVLDRVEVSNDRNWVDGIFSLRGKTRITPTWSLGGYGDIGGGGSNLTYQLAGAASVDLSRRYGLEFGYRYLNVDYNKDEFLFDTGMGGPIFGFAIRF
jgi:hypothetical protein